MNPSVYTRPNKPRFMTVRNRVDIGRFNTPNIPDVLEVSAQSECFITPVDEAEKMASYLFDYASASTGTYADFSAGTGRLIGALLGWGVDASRVYAVERDYTLVKTLMGNYDGVTVTHECFLSQCEERKNAPVIDYILLNPPFKKVRAHMRAAYNALNMGGVMVALVPVSFSASYAEYEDLEILDDDIFAGISVSTKIIRVKK